MLRITAPLFLGVFIYLLVLMIFDDLARLEDYFFNQEALLCIAITYLFSEAQRLLNNLFLPRLENAQSVKTGLLLLFAGGLAATSLLVFAAISSYFIYQIGYSWGTFFTELNVFLWIYSFIYLLYFMVLSSAFLFGIENKRALEKENLLKKNIDLKLRIFSRIINPEFLYRSLETLITLIQRKDKSSEKFIHKLSHVYRSVLNTRNDDLALLDSEMEIAESAIYLYNQQFANAIQWKTGLENEEESRDEPAYLLPGSMMIVLEWVINSSIIQPARPLVINIFREEDYLVVEYSLWEKLMPLLHYKEKLNELEGSLRHFSQKPFVLIKAEDKAYIKIPLLYLEPAA